MSVSYCVSNFEGNFYKMLQEAATGSVMTCSFTSAFASASVYHFTNFLKFIQHYLKKDSHKFLCIFMDSSKLSHPHC